MSPLGPLNQRKVSGTQTSALCRGADYHPLFWQRQLKFFAEAFFQESRKTPAPAGAQSFHHQGPPRLGRPFQCFPTRAAAAETEGPRIRLSEPAPHIANFRRFPVRAMICDPDSHGRVSLISDLLFVHRRYSTPPGPEKMAFLGARGMSFGRKRHLSSVPPSRPARAKKVPPLPGRH